MPFYKPIFKVSFKGHFMLTRLLHIALEKRERSRYTLMNVFFELFVLVLWTLLMLSGFISVIESLSSGIGFAQLYFILVCCICGTCAGLSLLYLMVVYYRQRRRRVVVMTLYAVLAGAIAGIVFIEFAKFLSVEAGHVIADWSGLFAIVTGLLLCLLYLLALAFYLLSLGSPHTDEN